MFDDSHNPPLLSEHGEPPYSKVHRPDAPVRLTIEHYAAVTGDSWFVPAKRSSDARLPPRTTGESEPDIGLRRRPRIGIGEVEVNDQSSYAFGLCVPVKRTGRPRAAPLPFGAYRASSDPRMGRSLKWARSGRMTATRRTWTGRRRRSASRRASLVCSWVLVWVRVVVIGTFFSDRVGLLCDRAVLAEGMPGDPHRHAAGP